MFPGITLYVRCTTLGPVSDLLCHELGSVPKIFVLLGLWFILVSVLMSFWLLLPRLWNRCRSSHLWLIGSHLSPVFTGQMLHTEIRFLTWVLFFPPKVADTALAQAHNRHSVVHSASSWPPLGLSPWMWTFRSKPLAHFYTHKLQNSHLWTQLENSEHIQMAATTFHN